MAVSKTEETLADYYARESGIGQGSSEGTGSAVATTVSRAPQLFSIAAADDDLLVTMDRSVRHVVTAGAEEEPVHIEPEVVVASGTVARVSNIEPLVNESSELHTL